MTATAADGCEHCHDRSIRPEDTKHREACAKLAAKRTEAARVSDLPPVAVDDLFCHLTTPRAGGPVCTPAAAVEVIRYVTALGWRPAVGRWAA